ncbi:MAG: hypothetical protein OEY49_16645, partial [Candidatus Heimdallarchaeota archaeon]|nr:hypothetical protein [Candidatus Heimdallarchaeota archaeon]
MHILDELGIEFDKDIFTSSEIQRILKFFHDINILDILLMSRNEITSFVQLPLFKTKILYSELVKFRNGPLIQTFSDLIKLSDYKYWYLPIGVESIASLF